MKKFKSPLEAFEYWEKNTPDQEFLRQNHSGKLDVLTYKEAGAQARKVSNFLKNQGFPKQSKIALLSKNCDFWVMADLAIMMSGHVSVPIYPTLKDDSVKPIVEHSESTLVFAGKLDDFDGQKEAFTSVRIIGSDKYGTPGELSWEQIQEQNELICKVLAIATGEDLPANAETWWQWWQDYSGVVATGRKSVTTTATSTAW